MGLFVAIAVTLVLVWFQYRAVMGASPAARDTDASAWSYASRDLRGVKDEMAELHAQESENLQNYGWVDASAGVARIPLDRALQIVAEEGLPTWGDPNPQLRPIDLIQENANEP